MVSGHIFRTFYAPLVAFVLFSACVSTVRPTGPEVLGALDRGPALASYLRGRGYETIDLSVFGGPRPADVASCIEKARGSAVTGVDVVRVCFDAANRPLAVYVMQTHGQDWRRLDAPSSRGCIDAPCPEGRT